MNLKKRIAAWGRVIYSLLATFDGVEASIFDAKETVKILNGGKSFIRFGDGEFGIYRRKDIHYQKWSIELKEEFDRIKEDYEKSPDTCPYLLAVPKSFMEVSGWKLMKKRVYVSSWAESRLQFKRSFRRDIVYGDAFLFEKKNKELYSRIWQDEDCASNAIFIHNSEECAKLFASTYKKNTVYVKCPSKDAFECVDDLEKEIQNIISANQWTDRDVMLTISAGPAGKVLAYRFSKLGYYCIDAGHCWDDPLEGI